MCGFERVRGAQFSRLSVGAPLKFEDPVMRTMTMRWCTTSIAPKHVHMFFRLGIMPARDRVSVFALWERKKSVSKADVAWEKKTSRRYKFQLARTEQKTGDEETLPTEPLNRSIAFFS